MLDNCAELYKFRALIRALVVRHLNMRYRGSVLGFLWSFLNPLCLMLVYALVFTYYMRFNQVDHYTIFLFCGLLPWLWVSSALLEGASSIVSGGHLITKSMFPPLVLPAVAVITNLVHFLFALPLLFIFMLAVGMMIHWTVLLLPLLLAVQLVFLYWAVLALSALNVYWRDVQHITGNLLTLLFFLCPILYPVAVVPDKLRFTMDFNPFALFTLFYHNLILEGVLPPLSSVVVLLCFVAMTVIVGSSIYANYNETFAELV